MSRHSPHVTRHSAKALRFSAISLTLALLVAIVVCSLTSSPNMSELPFIPTWLGTWADRNGNLRNFPVFAVLAALLFFVLKSSQLNTANCKLKTALRAAVCASALGILLEVAQLLLPNRHADPMDLLWMTLGAFAGAFGAGLASSLLPARSI